MTAKNVMKKFGSPYIHAESLVECGNSRGKKLPKRNNIPLIRISHTEIDKIEERLSDELSKLVFKVLSESIL